MQIYGPCSAAPQHCVTLNSYAFMFNNLHHIYLKADMVPVVDFLFVPAFLVSGWEFRLASTYLEGLDACLFSFIVLYCQ